ncbi:pyrimidine dimer DNA glycosylase/endonuclease V [Georgenia sp. SYP-B2076]|uniref:pyrimidine dimer DNA glycosylase/endonuclease V n=1 Tax=Georgenia sp. SYP-B2076 TaxID=2495881 RepID=UPI000F8F03D7|nr:pyrimidine dimer DNA glycosylase/endonuclease V [Georgenia sp. SYP-B2076]
MRMWSLHPAYLDRQGLTACWRESLLAQAVLAGRTKGYRHHPQLARFQAQPDPLGAVGAYLAGLVDEATSRGYRYDATKILTRPRGWCGPEAREPGATDPACGTLDADAGPPEVAGAQIDVTTGQAAYEWEHLMAKLHLRSPERARQLAGVAVPALHPLFRLVPGPVAEWEVRPAAPPE